MTASSTSANLSGVDSPAAVAPSGTTSAPGAQVDSSYPGAYDWTKLTIGDEAGVLIYARNVPSKPADSAAAWYFASAPSIPPSFAPKTALVKNTLRAPAGPVEPVPASSVVPGPGCRGRLSAGWTRRTEKMAELGQRRQGSRPCRCPALGVLRWLHMYSGGAGTCG